MNLLHAILRSPAVHRLGWALLHSVWEGAAVMLLLAIALAVLRRRGPQARYVASCVAMAGLLALPSVTFLLTTPPPPATERLAATEPPHATPPLPEAPEVAEHVATSPVPAAAGNREPAAVALPAGTKATRTTAVGSAAWDTSPSAPRMSTVPDVPLSLPTPESPAVPASPPAHLTPPPPPPDPAAAPESWAKGQVDRLSPAIPWVVLGWAVGVLWLSIWKTGAWLSVRRLKSRSTLPVSPTVEAAAAKLAARLRLARPVRLLQSALADSPLVIGFFKPLVLLPVSVLSELPVAQLEALLAHELAHVRRHDYLANLLQSVAETLLFYHPAAWWVSSRIRAERENCCDDLAVQVTRDRTTYVRALAAVAGVRAPALAPAATGAELLPRLRRLLGRGDADRPSWWAAGAAVALLAIFAVVATRLPSPATAGPDTAPKAMPKAVPTTKPAADPLAGALPVVTVEPAPADSAADDAPPPVLPDGSRDGKCELSGRVVDASGKAVEGAKVYFANQFLHTQLAAFREDAATWKDGRAGPAVVTSDARGRFAFNLLYAGHSDVWAETAAGIGWLRDVDTNARGVKIRLELKPDPRDANADTVSFEGTVVDTDARPAAGARMLLLGGESPAKVLAEAKTDPAGSYRVAVARSVSDDPSVRFLRLVCARDGAAVAWRTLPCWSGTGIDLRLQPMVPVHGRITSIAGKPIGGATVWAASIAAPDYGQLNDYEEELGFAISARTDPRGNFTLALPRGSRATLRASHPEYGSTWGAEVNLVRDEEHAVNIRVRDGILIEGTVRLKATDEPVAGATVTLGYPAQPPRTTTTDPQGHYLFRGVDEFDGKTHRDVQAEAGGAPASADRPATPPQWEAKTYYQQPLHAGQHATIDLFLERSAALRLADWKQKPGTPLPGKYRAAVLDHVEPAPGAKDSKDHPADTLTVRDSAGKVLWQKAQFHIYPGVGSAHRLAVDPDRNVLWLVEDAGSRVVRMSLSGDVLGETGAVGKHSAAIDPKSGDAWTLEQRETLAGSSLVVYNAAGERTHGGDVEGLDIAYSPHDDCFWVCGKKLQKVGRDGKVLAESEAEFPWYAVSVSVSDRDGSVWVAEGWHPNVADSRGRVWVFDPAARVRKRFSVDWDNRQVVVDPPRNVAWVVGQCGLYKVDPDGKVLAAAPLVYGSVAVEPDTGYVWFAGREGTWRLDAEGRPVWGEATPKSQKWVCQVCLLPP